MLDKSVEKRLKEEKLKAQVEKQKKNTKESFAVQLGKGATIGKRLLKKIDNL